ncbi:MAG: amino acid adenylation domain-containing protein [Gammaproteobacteria bacterium]
MIPNCCCPKNSDRTLLSAFDRQCRSAPDRIALVEGDRQLSYGQLRARVKVLSNRILRRKSLCRRVVVALDRGIDAAIAIFAVLDAGACYIPLDLKNPAERLSFILGDADPQCVIGIGPRPDWVHEAGLWLALGESGRCDRKSPEPSRIEAERIAAILYTSGSTGSPKGVALSHRALFNFADWAADAFEIGQNDRIASLAPFHFDLSVFDLFSTLTRGGEVHFVPSALTCSPSRLTAWLGEKKITVFYTVPSLLAFIALKGSLSTTPLLDLRVILFAGEIFPNARLKMLCDLLPHVDFYNLYGPTETNVCCFWKVDRERLNIDQPIPIGRSACGAVLKIDEATGELWVKSANNLSGYWRGGRLAEPLSIDDFYPTGDKVSLNRQGEYCYHGRLDRMLKCSGYRVEPAEVEAALFCCPGVLSCAVVGLKDWSGGHRLAAALVLKPSADLDVIVKLLKQKLPPYMLPGKFKVLESMPSLSNGKVDYRKLLQQLEAV